MRETVQPGDVLLSRGRDNVSDFVCALDGGTYSHSSLFVGNGNIIEATDQGVDEHSLQALSGQLFVDVFRNTNRSAGANSAVASAQIPRSGIFDYQSLLISVVYIGATKRLPADALMVAVRRFGARIVSGLNDRLDESKNLMVCTEVVSRCYWFSQGDRSLALHVKAPFDPSDRNDLLPPSPLEHALMSGISANLHAESMSDQALDQIIAGSEEGFRLDFDRTRATLRLLGRKALLRMARRLVDAGDQGELLYRVLEAICALLVPLMSLVPNRTVPATVDCVAGDPGVERVGALPVVDFRTIPPSWLERSPSLRKVGRLNPGTGVIG